MRVETLVLGYHAVSPAWRAPTSVTPAAFDAQIGTLIANGWAPATLVDALTAPEAERTFAVTFDDAHLSVLEHAAPILARHGAPATVFVPTDYAEQGTLMGWDGYDVWLGTDAEEELRCLTWERLRELDGRGWEIASHTCSHPRLTKIDDAQLERELTRSRELCEERIGSACHSIAYPYSDVDDRVARAARKAGYGIGVTVPRGHAAALPLLWPRVGVYHGEDARRMQLRIWRRRHAQLDAALAPAARAARRAVAALPGR